MDADDQPRRHARRVVPPPVRRRTSPTSTGTTRTSAASTRTSSAFWFDRGAAGIRIDSAALLVKDPTLPEVPAEPGPGEHPNTDRDELHDDLPQLAARSPTATPARASSSASCGCRTSSGSPATSGRTSSTRRSTSTSWPGRGTPRALRELDRRDARRPRAGRRARDVAPLQPRRHPAGHPLRAEDSRSRSPRKRRGTPTDLRPRAAPGPRGRLLAAALPGSLYIYQGDELGLDEVAGPAGRPAPGPDALPLGRRRSRARRLPGAAARGRATQPPFGFSPRRRARRAVAAASPAGWAALTVEAQARRPGLDAQPVSRRAAHPPRRARPRRRTVRAGSPSADGVLAFGRGDGFVCDHQPRRRPPSRCRSTASVLLASARPRRRPPAARRHRRGCALDARRPADGRVPTRERMRRSR